MIEENNILNKDNPRQIQLISQDEFNNLDSTNQLKYLCILGILAPTTHNTVPERFKLYPKKESIEIYLDRKFVLKHSDKIGRQACISIGCVLKNIELSSLFYELTPTIYFLNNDLQLVKPLGSYKSRYTPLIKIELKKSKFKKGANGKLLNKLIERKVVRAEYNDKITISNSMINELKKIVLTEYENIDLTVLTSKQELHQIGKLQEDADRTVFEDQNFVKELGKWLLPNDSSLQYGMKGREFGFDDDFAKLVHLGLLGKEKLLPDQIANFARGGRVVMESSPSVCLISVKEDDIKSWINSGRVYIHLALELLVNNFFNAIHGGLIEVDWVKEVLVSTVLHSTSIPTVIFRVGVPKRKAEQDRPYSTRPNLSDLII